MPPSIDLIPTVFLDLTRALLSALAPESDSAPAGEEIHQPSPVVSPPKIPDALARLQALARGALPDVLDRPGEGAMDGGTRTSASSYVPGYTIRWSHLPKGVRPIPMGLHPLLGKIGYEVVQQTYYYWSLRPVSKKEDASARLTALFLIGSNFYLVDREITSWSFWKLRWDLEATDLAAKSGEPPRLPWGVETMAIDLSDVPKGEFNQKLRPPSTVFKGVGIQAALALEAVNFLKSAADLVESKHLPTIKRLIDLILTGNSGDYVEMGELTAELLNRSNVDAVWGSSILYHLQELLKYRTGVKIFSEADYKRIHKIPLETGKASTYNPGTQAASIGRRASDSPPPIGSAVSPKPAGPASEKPDITDSWGLQSVSSSNVIYLQPTQNAQNFSSEGMLAVAKPAANLSGLTSYAQARRPMRRTSDVRHHPFVRNVARRQRILAAQSVRRQNVARAAAISRMATLSRMRAPAWALRSPVLRLSR